MQCTSFKLLVPLLAVSVILLVRAAPADDSKSANNDTDTTIVDVPDEKYTALAARLNCSELVVSHEGTKFEQLKTGTIFRPVTTTTTTTTTEAPPQKVRILLPWEDDDEDYQDDDKDENEKSKRSANGMAVSAVTNGSQTEDVSNDAGSKKKNDTTAVSLNYTCMAPFYDDGPKYYWYQVILDNGGPPGAVNATKLKPNATVVKDPCARPIGETTPPSGDLLYKYEQIKYQKLYRQEVAFLRFAGTPAEFVDVSGQMVWAPPGWERRFYRLSYHQDDTGFYVDVHHAQNCTFTEEPLLVKCDHTDFICICEETHEFCYKRRTLSQNLVASLIGG